MCFHAGNLNDVQHGSLKLPCAFQICPIAWSSLFSFSRQALALLSLSLVGTKSQTEEFSIWCNIMRHLKRWKTRSTLLDVLFHTLGIRRNDNGTPDFVLAFGWLKHSPRNWERETSAMLVSFSTTTEMGASGLPLGNYETSCKGNSCQIWESAIFSRI